MFAILKLGATAKAHWSIVFDVILIACMLIPLFFFYKHKKAMRIFLVNLLFLIFYVIIWIINKYTGNLTITLDLIRMGFFALIVINIMHYQQDIRTLMTRLARSLDRRKVLITRSSEEDLIVASSEIVKACRTFSKNSVGALMVITPDDFDDKLIESGTILNAKVSASLLESIFSTKGPLHDGAVLIKGDMILAAGCLLPNSDSSAISPELGTRHRAAIGVSESMNVLAVVNSEENGVISIAIGGRLKRYMTPEQLNEQILEVLKGDLNVDSED